MDPDVSLIIALIDAWLNANLHSETGNYQQLLSWKEGTWPTDLTDAMDVVGVHTDVDDICVHEARRDTDIGFIIVFKTEPDGDGIYNRYMHVYNVNGHDTDSGWQTIDPSTFDA